MPRTSRAGPSKGQPGAPGPSKGQAAAGAQKAPGPAGPGGPKAPAGAPVSKAPYGGRPAAGPVEAAPLFRHIDWLARGPGVRHRGDSLLSEFGARVDAGGLRGAGDRLVLRRAFRIRPATRSGRSIVAVDGVGSGREHGVAGCAGGGFCRGDGLRADGPVGFAREQHADGGD